MERHPIRQAVSDGLFGGIGQDIISSETAIPNSSHCDVPAFPVSFPTGSEESQEDVLDMWEMMAVGKIILVSLAKVLAPTSPKKPRSWLSKFTSRSGLSGLIETASIIPEEDLLGMLVNSEHSSSSSSSSARAFVEIFQSGIVLHRIQ